MRANGRIRFHRAGFECVDAALVRRIRDEYHRYMDLLMRKKLAEPLAEIRDVTLSDFTLQLVIYGVDVMKLEIDQKTAVAIRMGGPR